MFVVSKQPRYLSLTKALALALLLFVLGPQLGSLQADFDECPTALVLMSKASDNLGSYTSSRVGVRARAIPLIGPAECSRTTPPASRTRSSSLNSSPTLLRC